MLKPWPHSSGATSDQADVAVLFLVDTNVLVRTAFAPERLSAACTAILRGHEAQVGYSAVVPWELSIKCKSGKLVADLNQLMKVLVSLGWRELPIDGTDGLAAGQLPLHHRDPFDRLIVAQAIRHRLTVLTNDEAMTAYDASILLG